MELAPFLLKLLISASLVNFVLAWIFGQVEDVVR